MNRNDLIRTAVNLCRESTIQRFSYQVCQDQPYVECTDTQSELIGDIDWIVFKNNNTYHEVRLKENTLTISAWGDEISTPLYSTTLNRDEVLDLTALLRRAAYRHIQNSNDIIKVTSKYQGPEALLDTPNE